MENQHKLIKGYRDLTQAEIDEMNAIKELAKAVGDRVEALMGNPAHDPRWVALGRTHLQMGFMFLTRGVTKPEFF
jgi:hypothetical protein